MANKTMKKVKDNVRKGMAEVGKTAAHLKADVKAEATRIQVTSTDAEPRHISRNKTDAEKAAEKASEAVELIFGVNAGTVWEALNLNGGPMSVTDLAEATSLLPEEIYGALGWLGRENKISIERVGTVRVYSLRL